MLISSNINNIMVISSLLGTLIKQTQSNDDLYTSVLIPLICLISMVAIVLMSSLRVSRVHQRLVIFRLGQSVGVRGPGLVFIIPFIERGVIVELGEQERELRLSVNTREGAQAKFDVGWIYQVFDPEKSLLSVRDLEDSAEQAIATTLRTLISDMFISEVVHDRRRLEIETEARLSQLISMWGAELIRFEIKDIRRG